MKCLGIVLCIGVKSYFISLTLLKLNILLGHLYLAQVQFKLNTSLKYISNVSHFYFTILKSTDYIFCTFSFHIVRLGVTKQ